MFFWKNLFFSLLRLAKIAGETKSYIQLLQKRDCEWWRIKLNKEDEDKGKEKPKERKLHYRNYVIQSGITSALYLLPLRGVRMISGRIIIMLFSFENC